MQRKYTKNFKKIIKDFYEKVVGCNFDGASVMSGKRDGVQEQIRRQQPGCVYCWRIAHRLELAVLDAVKHDDYLSEFEDIINNIFLMHYVSPKLRQEFKVFGEQLDEITKKFGGLKRVRWLASLFRAMSMLAKCHQTKMSLVFQTDNLCVCSVPHYIEENIASLEELQVVPEENFRKL